LITTHVRQFPLRELPAAFLSAGMSMVRANPDRLHNAFAIRLARAPFGSLLHLWVLFLFCIGMAVPAAAATDQHERLSYRFAVGTTMAYQLDYRNESQADLSHFFQDRERQPQAPDPATGHRTSVTTTMRGEAQIMTVSVRDSQVLLGFRVEHPQVGLILNGQVADADARAVEGDLHRDLFLLLNRQGRVLSVQFPPTIRELTKGFVRTLVALTQFVVQENGNGSHADWESLEDDPQGSAVVRYERIPDSSSHRVYAKTRLRYLPLKPTLRPGDIPVKLTVTPSGTLTAQFDSQAGQLASLAGTVAETTSISGKPVAHATTTIAWTRVKTQRIDNGQLDALRKQYAEYAGAIGPSSLSARPTEEESETAIHRSELKDATIDSLLADLANTEADPHSTNETSLFLKFKALVYLHPDTSARLGMLLTNADANGATMRVLSGALGDVGHPDAQQALVAAIRARPTDGPALTLLLSALGNATTPSVESEAVMRTMAEHSADPEVRMTAELMLGHMARSLAATAPTRTDAIVTALVRALNNASDEDRKGQILSALGNAGSATALPTLKQYLRHASSSLRIAATSALRFVEHHEVDGLLAGLLASDTDGNVRAEAATALGFREPTATVLQVEKQALLADKSLKVRLTVLHNLWNARENFPEAKELVKIAAEKDPASDVRQAARDIMIRNSDEFPNVPGQSTIS
jgi:hypothetical protein